MSHTIPSLVLVPECGNALSSLSGVQEMVESLARVRTYEQIRHPIRILRFDYQICAQQPIWQQIISSGGDLLISLQKVCSSSL